MIARKRALAENPALPGAWNDLGLRCFERGLLGEAIAAFSRSLLLQPVNPGTRSNLGSAHQYRGDLGAAIDAFRSALGQAPDNAAIHLNLGNVLLEQGRAGEAVRAYRTALALSPGLARAEMNLSAAHLYLPGGTLAAILAHAKRWSRLVPSPAVPASRPDSLKLGIISADFRQHAVGYLTIPAIEGLKKAGWELTFYSNSLREDALTARFKACAAEWRDVATLTDAQLDAQIRADGIGILLDLSGFSAGNRLAALARKPAPIQIAAWVGYPATTGSPAMDYVLADRHQLPAEAEPYFSERVIRLPDSYVCFEPPPGAPEVGAPPCLATGHVTFGSFNALKKINPAVIALWSRILRAVPDSRLLMKAGGLDCPATRERFTALFAAHGVESGRLHLVGTTSPAEHLAWMARADLALDPFPYSGGRTTLEALWMGLPVITLPQASFASRHSLGYLQTLGLSEWVASDEDHYVALATTLALAPGRWRNNLRDRILSSPLVDSEKFVRDLDGILSAIWR